MIFIDIYSKLKMEIILMIISFICSRLFLGMGIIWYFELLAFALDLDDKEQRSLYFFDFLNMMQVLDITP